MNSFLHPSECGLPFMALSGFAGSNRWAIASTPRHEFGRVPYARTPDLKARERPSAAFAPESDTSAVGCSLGCCRNFPCWQRTWCNTGRECCRSGVPEASQHKCDLTRTVTLRFDHSGLCSSPS